MEVKSVTKANTEIQPPDGGWGWAVCFAAFMSNFTVSGITATNGIILLGLRDLFNESITKTSLVSSFLSGATMFGGPLVLVLIIYKASHRQIMMLAGIIAVASAVASMFAPSVEILILTYGILAGLSLAMSYFAGNIVLGYYFDKKRALALGIANSGTGCGSFLLSYFIEKSVSFYGTRGTFLLIGGVFLNLVVYGSLCRPLKPGVKTTHYISESRRTSEDQREGVTNFGFTPEENIETPVGQSASSHRCSIEGIEPMPETLQMRKLSIYSEKMPSNFANLRSRYCDTAIFRNKNFGLLLTIYILWAVGDSMLIYLPAYAESIGLSREEGAMLMSIYGIVATLSQILAGFLVDVVHIPISYLLFTTLFGMSLGTLAIPFCQTFATLALSTAIFGTGYSSGIAIRIVLVAAILGIEKMSEAYSIISILVGVGYIVYPIISGHLHDATRSFPVIFYTDFAIAFMATILSCGIIYGQKKGKFVNKQ